MNHYHTDPDDPASTRPVSQLDGQEYPAFFGLTKREWFAGQALQGLLASVGGNEWPDRKGVSMVAVEMANAVIEELNKEKP